jgi:hypothetical protein
MGLKNKTIPKVVGVRGVKVNNWWIGGEVQEKKTRKAKAKNGRGVKKGTAETGCLTKSNGRPCMNSIKQLKIRFPKDNEARFS